MADVAFTGRIEPQQVIAFVHRRIGEQTTLILKTAETLRGLADQLEDIAALPATADPYAIRGASIGLGAIATQAALYVSALPAYGMALAVLCEVRQLGSDQE